MSTLPAQTSAFLPEGFPQRKPVTVPFIAHARARGEQIVCLTAYDAPTAAIAEEAGIDLVLVGDSLGTVVQGKRDTLSITLDEMIYHARCVAAQLRTALLVVDLPFGSFQIGRKETLKAGIRVLKETPAAAIKIEGGKRVAKNIAACVAQDIPVLGHLGLTPQSVHAFGGFKQQGKNEAAIKQLLEDAKMVEDAGAFAIVLEAVPTDVAQKLRQSVHLPIIGIGAGPNLDGQILVFHDILGLLPKTPSFVPKYAQLGEQAVTALKRYKDDVVSGRFQP